MTLARFTDRSTRSLHPLTWALALACAGVSLASAPPASAQDAGCETDADCADTERCEAGLVLAECPQDECPEPPPGRCVDEFYQEECDVDGDCGDNLVCLRLMIACPPFEPDCAQDMPGFCDEEGSDAVLAATSGLAPSDADPSAQSGGPTTATGGEAPDMGSSESGAGESSSGGCSVAAGSAGVGHAAWLALALVGLRRRRR